MNFEKVPDFKKYEILDIQFKTSRESDLNDFGITYHYI